MKRFFTLLIFAVLFGGYAMADCNPPFDYFTSVCSSGQTLRYHIDLFSSTEVYVSYDNNYGKPTGNLVIPSSVTYTCYEYDDDNNIIDTHIYSFSVTGISSFSDCTGLTSVTIPSTITSIPSHTFEGCSDLTSVIIPSSVTSIGEYAFYGCSSLASVTIPNLVTVIDNHAFCGCSSLASATIPNSVTVIRDYAFYGCSSLESITISESVTIIGSHAFGGCTGLKTINYNAIDCNPRFNQCTSLTTVNIGENVTRIASDIFNGCSGLTTVNFNATNCTLMGSFDYPVFKNCNANATINIGNNVTVIPKYAFKGLIGQEALVIPNSVTNIGECAFYDCSGFASVTIGNSVTNIAESAFYGCSGLASIAIPSSVISIGQGAFRGCSGLEEMTIPFVGRNATAPSNIDVFGYIFGIPGSTTNFDDYNIHVDIPSSLRSVTVTGGNLREGAFYSCSMLTSITLPDSITDIGDNAFYNCSGLSSLTIPSSVTSIGSGAFSGCSGLSSFVIPDSVAIIYPFTFEGCSGLTSITIHESIDSIGASAFASCSGLTSVNFNATNCKAMCYNYANGRWADNVSYNNWVFRDCTSLTTLNVGENVTNIPNYAFADCSGLTSVVIPNSVTNIGTDAFSGCNEMEMVTIGSSVESIGSGAFYCNGLTTVNFNATNCVTMGRMGYNRYYPAFDGCSLFSNLNIGENVTNIPNYAFYGCSGLTSLTIPNSVTSIGYMAFYNCSGLTSLTIGNSVTNISSEAFDGCSGLTDIYVNRTTPPTVNSCGFTNFTASVWVPCGSLETYRSAAYWSIFSDIREMLPYTLNVSSADLTMGTASVTQQPTCSNDNATIVATPNEGYRFVQWNDNNTDNPRTITLTSNVEYIALFEALTAYSITAVSADEEMGTVTGGGDYYEDETVTLTATANDGYWFVAWTDGNTDNPRTVTVTGDATYTATFIAFHTITVTSADETLGTASGSGDYAEGLEIEISATPAEHYHFAQWNDGNTDNPRTITVTEDETFTASFAIDRFTITVESNDEAMGIVSESGTYDYGTEIQISATPAEGYGFLAWNDGDTDNPRIVIVTEDITYTATFGVLRTISVVSADETMGTVQGTGEYVEGATAQITAIPNEHYHFVHWIVEENPTREIITDNPLTITVTGNVTYRAEFAIDRHTITVESDDETMGTVNGSNTYDYGTEIQISATAADHYHFLQWNDGNTDNPRTITVTEDATYRAEFAIDRFTITVESADEAMGIVSESNTYDYGTEIQISATAREHYHFVQWNDTNTDNPRTITVTEDATYRAEFAIDRFTITVESADEAMGTVSEGGTYDYGSEIQISASARDGYQFVSWDDGNTDNPRTITVVADATYIASFMSVVGIEENAVSEIALFPNPANDILNISSSETISEIEIVNVMGQVVKRIEVNADNAVCDVEELKAGVYVVRICTLSGVEGSATLSQRKFVKE